MVRASTVEARASIEAAARDARYAALEARTRSSSLSSIWLAHTARDQAETVLMRILRGTGPAGLAGIPPHRGLSRRPLLDVPRDGIDAYVAARDLPTWDDPMNDDMTLTRVRIRTQILPALRHENPQLDAALCRLATLDARVARGDRRARRTVRDACRSTCSARHAGRGGSQARLAIALEAAGLGYDAAHLDAIDELVVAPQRGERSIDLPRGRLVRSYDVLDLRHSSELAGGRSRRAARSLRAAVWQPGDRMKPARLKGRSRKLSDLFIDAKVPRERSARRAASSSARAMGRSSGPSTSGSRSRSPSHRHLSE